MGDKPKVDRFWCGELSGSGADEVWGPAESTGIFSHRTVKPAKWTADNPDLGAFRALAKAPPTLEAQIEKLRQPAADFLASCGYDTDYPECCKIPTDGIDPIIRDCRTILVEASQALLSLANGDIRSGMWCALRLGAANVRSGIRPFEAPAVEGMKAAGGRQKSKEARSANAKMWEYIAEDEQLRKLEPDLNASERARRIAEKCHGDSEYIRKVITGPPKDKR